MDTSISDLISLLSSGSQLNIQKDTDSSDIPNNNTPAIKVSGIDVILKRLDSTRHQEFDYSKFQNIVHPNIAKYYYSPLQEKELLMVEYVEERDILTFIAKLSINVKKFQEPNVNSLSIINRVKIMSQVALAMNYLHSHNLPHLNLKPTHILLNKRGIVKLTGYGLFSINQNFSTNDKFLRFKSPEVLFKNLNQISLKSDVYSFGIIFWELLTGQMAFDGNIENLGNLLMAGHRPVINNNMPEILGQIIAACWQEDPNLRPTFQEIQTKLEEIILSSPFDNRRYYDEMIEISGRNINMPVVLETIKNSQDLMQVNSAISQIVNLLAYPKNKLQFKLYDNVCEELSQSGIIPRMISTLYCSDFPDLQFNSACVLTNIISGIHARALVDNGVLPALMHSCKSTNKDVFTQSCWLFGNISEEACYYHEDIVNLGVLNIVVGQFKTLSLDYSSREIVVWLLSNLVQMRKDKSFPDLETIADAIPILVEYIDYKNQDIQLNVLKGIHRLTFGDKRKNLAMFQYGFLPKIIQILYNNNEKLVIVALKILSNFSSDEDQFTIGIFELLEKQFYFKFLQHADTDFRMEFGLLLSNFLAVPFLANKIKDLDIMPLMFEILQDNFESSKVKLEILYCLKNSHEMKILETLKFQTILNQLSSNPDLSSLCKKFLNTIII